MYRKFEKNIFTTMNTICDISVLLQTWPVILDKNWLISLSILFGNVNNNLKYQIYNKYCLHKY